MLCFCHRKIQKRGDNSQTRNSRVTVITCNTHSSIGGHVYAIIWILVDAWQSYRAEGIFVHTEKIRPDIATTKSKYHIF